MSRHEAELDALIRGVRAARPAGRWQAQRRLFRRLGLGGGSALLLAHASFAFASRGRVKIAAVCALGAAAILGSFYGVTHAPVPEHTPALPQTVATTRDPVVEPTAPSAAAPNTPAAVAHPPVPDLAVPTVSIDALPPATPTTTTGPRASKAAAPSDEDDLARETASVRGIRGKVDSRDFSAALDGIRAHRASFPHGVLEQEVAVLEIEASRGIGREDRACALGRAFLDTHPTSAHRTRVAALMRRCSQ